MIVTADSTHVHRGRRDAPRPSPARLAQIRAELARAVHDRDVEILQERIARLSAKLAVIRVGAPTEVGAARSASGAPRARWRRPRRRCPRASCPAAAPRCCARRAALDALELEGDYARGVEIVRDVLAEPLYWIASNAGYDGQAAIDQVRAMPDGPRPRTR